MLIKNIVSTSLGIFRDLMGVLVALMLGVITFQRIKIFA